MYFSYYGLKEPPFNLTPNSRFFFSSHQHREALDSLLYAINQRKGFIVITGDIGSGKTTVCRTLLNRLPVNTQVALITNTHVNSKDLLLTLLEDLEIPHQPNWAKSKLLSALNDYLISQLHAGHNVVLIIDEAQNLKPAVLEEIRMMSNLETETEKLIQIILIGQPELKDTLALARLEQLRQRIAVYYHLKPLTQEEMIHYIEYRLKTATEIEGKVPRFSPEAYDAIYRFSKGVPRLINQICDFALLTGYVDEVSVIEAQMINEVIGESPQHLISREKDKNEEEKSHE